MNTRRNSKLRTSITRSLESILMIFLETHCMQRSSNIFLCTFTIFQKVLIETRFTLMETITWRTMNVRVIQSDLLSFYLICPKMIKLNLDSRKTGGKRRKIKQLLKNWRKRQHTCRITSKHKLKESLNRLTDKEIHFQILQ